MEVIKISFVVKQPNGLYCIFDYIDAQPKKWNLTREEYIKSCIEKAKQNAIEVLDNAHDFRDVYESFMEDKNMTEDDFNKFLKKVGCNRKYEDLMGFWDD